MRAFAAIVHLTFRNAMRSHIFQLLLGLLLLCVGLIPTTISGDGTATGFIQISLLYSLSAVMLVLSLSSVWLGCYVMTQDVDSYQLHMVITKPVSRVTIWLGKFSGILLINTILLIFSTTIIYFIMLAKFYQQDFSKEDRARIENEVMVGRRVFWPDRPDLDQIARSALSEKLKVLEAQGKEIDRSPQGQERMLAETKREIQAQMSELKPGQTTYWTFSNIPADLQRPLYMRYRLYIDKVATEGQRLTHGLWQIGKPRINEERGANVFEQARRQDYDLHMFNLSEMPEQVKSGDFHEKVFPPEWGIVTPDGKVVLGYTNFDRQNGTQHFQPGDGPKILLRVSGFAVNYFRAVFVIFLELVILTGLGCAAAAFLTMPTAIFVVISYLLFGSFASYMAETSYFGGAADYIGYYVGKILLLVVIPIQKFEVTNLVANGELVEFSFIWRLIFAYLLLRALPLFLFGILMYRRREMGLIIRK